MPATYIQWFYLHPFGLPKHMHTYLQLSIFLLFPQGTLPQAWPPPSTTTLFRVNCKPSSGPRQANKHNSPPLPTPASANPAVDRG